MLSSVVDGVKRIKPIETLRLEMHERIAVLTIDDPPTRNALTTDLLDALAHTLAGLQGDGCPAAVITGGTAMFASGADLRLLRDVSAEDYAASPRGDAWRALWSLELPLVAAVAGHALGGGCELAMLADILVAGDSARFGQPEVRLGLIPGAGGTQRWARAAGRFLAAEIVLAGRTLDAFEARDAGIVATVVPAERTVAAGLRTARRIAQAAPVAIRAARNAVRASEQLGLDAGLDLERDGMLRALATDDRREGIAAMLEHRRPTFTGR